MNQTFSVIIPTLNEAAHIEQHIAAVRALDPQVEIIVADGGSNDGTPDLVRRAGARLVNAPRGRGVQLNAGAAAATGAILLFLHADTALPVEAFPLLRAIFADPDVQIAKFRLSFDVSDPLLDVAARLMWFDSVWTSFGDQVMVLRRDFFNQLGGFPDWPLFEDVRLFELARARSEIYVAPACVITSARRFVQNGVLNQLLYDVWCMVRYLFGVPPHVIAGQYERGGAAPRGVGC